MKSHCRNLLSVSVRGRRLTWREAFPHAAIITDSKKLAQLNAAVAKRKQLERLKGK